MCCRATSEHFRGLEARAPRANCARGETPHITSRAGSPRSQGDGAHPIAGWKPALPWQNARAANAPYRQGPTVWQPAFSLDWTWHGGGCRIGRMQNAMDVCNTIIAAE